MHALGAHTHGSVSQRVWGGHTTRWKEFVNDFDLASDKSKFCKTSDTSRLFIAVNAASKFGKPLEDGSNEQTTTLTRVEFLMCLVNLAIMRYVMPGTLKDVSEALHVLVVC